MYSDDRSSFVSFIYLRDILVTMKNTKTGFFKGLQGFTRANDDILSRDAESSVYYWWWAFMRLSPVFWYANQTGLKPIDSRVAETYELAGNLESNLFGLWWRNTGKSLFEEARRPAKVRVIDVDELNEFELYEKSVVMEVPLSISTAQILKQFKKELSKHHEQRSLDIAATSNALFRLQTKRFNERTLESQYWVLLYRLLNDEIAVWRIGDRLQLSPGLKVRGVQRTHVEVRRGSSAFDRLHSLTGRHLYKAQYLQVNSEIGSFPNFTKVAPRTNIFGTKHERDFQAAIGGVIGADSAWHVWLQKNFGSDLKQEVIKRNFIQDDMKMPDSKIRKRFAAFYDGSNDELK